MTTTTAANRGTCMTTTSTQKRCGCGCGSSMQGAGATTQPSGCGCSGCGCGCTTSDPDRNPFLPSRQTQEALAQCIKQAVCDVLTCLEEAICPRGESREIRQLTTRSLENCLLTALCSFARCVPKAICPPKVATCTVIDVLPCDFAVEESLSVAETA
jgi:hypothetical protein